MLGDCSVQRAKALNEYEVCGGRNVKLCLGGEEGNQSRVFHGKLCLFCAPGISLSRARTSKRLLIPVVRPRIWNL